MKNMILLLALLSACAERPADCDKHAQFYIKDTALDCEAKKAET
jgi:hypothetical protein